MHAIDPQAFGEDGPELPDLALREPFAFQAPAPRTCASRLRSLSRLLTVRRPRPEASLSRRLRARPRRSRRRTPSIPPGRIGSCALRRAGGATGNHLAHSSFIPAKSSSSARMNVALSTLSRPLPAAVRIAWTLARHCRVCSWMDVPTTSPLTGSTAPGRTRTPARRRVPPGCRPMRPGRRRCGRSAWSRSAPSRRRGCSPAEHSPPRGRSPLVPRHHHGNRALRPAPAG